MLLLTDLLDSRAGPDTAHVFGYSYEEFMTRCALGDQFLHMTELELFTLLVDQVRGSHLNPKP